MKQRISLLFSFILLLQLFSCSFTNKQFPKINGISLEGSRNPVEIDFFNEIADANANWVSLMPYSYSAKGSNEIYYENLHWQWWGEGKTGTKECIRMAHEKGIKVMLKPHLWIEDGSFTGDLIMPSEKDWEIWEKSYSRYILDYAALAETMEVEIFCIGTELEKFVVNRPDYWKQLILEIRALYNGQLTYAANWNEYTKVPFWMELDLIGIDAYFPISDKRHPSIEELNNGWLKWKDDIKNLAKENQQKVLFTEYGYESIEFTTVTPWSVDKSHLESESEQAIAYEALYQTFWQEDWVVGGFLWKWHVPDHHPEKRIKRFTPQGKQAMDVIKKYYSKTSQ